MLNEVVFLKHVSLECFAKNYKFHLLMPINYSRSTEYGNILKIPMKMKVPLRWQYLCFYRTD